MSKILKFLTDLPKRVAVIATSIVTWAAVGAAVCTSVAATIGDTWPQGAAWALTAAGVLGALVVAVRSVTPVPADQRGILTKDT